MDVGELNGETSFAVICSFFNKFGALLGLKPLPFTKIENLLSKFDGAGRVDKELIDLHVKLLRGVQLKSANHTRWEQSLLKFCSLVPSLEAEFLQLERFGYVHSPLSMKLAILKALCECQFDFNPKFKENIIGSLGSSELRLLPVGYDKNGLAYWYQQDADLNIRIYTEEPDDFSGGTWELKAKSRDELANLLEELKGGPANPIPVKVEAVEPTDDGKENDDSKVKEEAPSSSSNAAAAPDKKDEDVKQEETAEPEPEPQPEKPAKEEKPMKTKNKKGTFMDTFQDEKKPPAKKTPSRRRKATQAEAVKEEDKIDDKSDDSQMDNIPDDLKPFIDRRIMPRRSARSAALTQIKGEEESPKGKGKKKEKKEANEDTKKPKKSKKPEPAVESEKSEDDDGDEEEDEDDSEVATSDSDFMPLSELRKVASGRKRRGKKPKLSLSDAELESDSDGEATVTKERKKATEETLCKKCNKSNNWEVLLLCDKCDEAWHTWCLKPQLWYVPDEDWFCPKCQHAMLVDKLTAALAALDEALAKKAVEDKKKQTAADRLKREMEFIGVSLNNIIPTQENAEGEPSEESEDDEDSDERRERRRKKKLAQLPLVPIAVGRSRRRVDKVDYNFEAYDELIQEAVDEIAEAPSKPKYRDPVRPQGGAGRGKDMANIIEAQRKKSDASGEASPGGPAVGKPPTKPAKSHRKLTDLDMDDVTESDTDEYKASDDEQSEQSDDEYVPSEDEDDEPKRRSTRIRAQRRKSDDEFVVSGSDSDYRPSKKAAKKRPTRAVGKRRKNDTSDESDDSLVAKSRAKRSKWGPKASSTESDQSSDESYSNKRSKKSVKKRVSDAGRPMRRARKSVNYSALDANSSSNEDEDSEKEKKAKNARPVGALTRPRRAKISSDEAEFEPEEEEEEEEGDEEEGKSDQADENEENEESGDEEAPASSSKTKEKPPPAKGAGRRKIESSSEESDDAEQSDDDQDDDAPEEIPLTMVSKQNSVDSTAATNGRPELLPTGGDSASQRALPNGNQLSGAVPTPAKVSVVVVAPPVLAQSSMSPQVVPATLPISSPALGSKQPLPPHPASISVIQPLARMAVPQPQPPMQNPYATMGALPYPYYHPGYGPPAGHPGQMPPSVQYAGLQPMAPYGMQQQQPGAPMGWPPHAAVMGRPMPPEFGGQDGAGGGGSGSLSDVLATAMQGEYQ